MGFPGGSEDKAFACSAGDPGSIPGLGRSPGEGNSNPLQYSCLENPMDREEPGGLQSMGSQRVGHDWATSLTFLHFREARWSYHIHTSRTGIQAHVCVIPEPVTGSSRLHFQPGLVPPIGHRWWVLLSVMREKLRHKLVNNLSKVTN